MATNNAINTPQITLGGPLTFSGAFTTTITVTNNTAVTLPLTGTLLSSATYPVAGAAAGKVIVSDGVNWVASTPTFPNASAAAGKFIRSDGTNWIASTPTLPTTSGIAGKILISDGTNYIDSTPTYPNASATSGKVIISDGTNYVASTPTYPNTSGTAGKILRSDGTNNVYSTSTFADTYTASNLLYSNGANTVQGLATGNDGVLVTSGTGVPSISSTLPAFTTSSITFNPTTGGIVGTTTNDNAGAGKVGEYISSSVLIASKISLTSNNTANVTSISLTAGDWDVTGNVIFVPNAATTTTFLQIGINTTSATMPTLGAENNSLFTNISFSAGTTMSYCTGPMRISLAATTTVYLLALSTFAINVMDAYGFIGARRVR